MDSTTADTFRQQERISYALFMNVNTSSTDFNFLWYCVKVSIYWRLDLAPASNCCTWVLLYTYWHGLQLSDSYSPFETWPRMIVLRAVNTLIIQFYFLPCSLYLSYLISLLYSPIWSTCSIWSTWSTRRGLKDLPSFGKARVCVCVHCYWHAETSFQFKDEK